MKTINGEIVVRFGDVTACEIGVMLEASSESGCDIATAILAKQRGNTFRLTLPEALYLQDGLYGDADRVAQAMGDAAGRAFERAGEKLGKLIDQFQADKP